MGRMQSLGFEKRARQAGLPDYARQCAHPQLGMVRYGYGDGSALFAFLHDDVAALPANLLESMAGQYRADLSTGEYTQPRHVLACGFGGEL